MGLWLITCWRVEDVVSVFTLVRRGAAQVCHVLRVGELREQLEVEEGRRRKGRRAGREEVESGEGRIKEKQPPQHGWNGDDCEMR